jgi:SAM-dependent methyltransferase/uncharacterized protein YbaR (Trm112 family)
MKTWLLDYLRCPFCTGRLDVELVVKVEAGEVQYGVLSCSLCNESFAVVEGIPILAARSSRLDIKAETTEEPVIVGAALSDVIEAVRSKDITTALALLLTPTSLSAPSWFFDPGRRRRRRSLPYTAATGIDPRTEGGPSTAKAAALEALKRPYRRMRARWRHLRMPQWRRKLALYLLAHPESLSAVELIDLYYGEYSGAHSIGEYFLFRLGQPRHLAALAALCPLREENGVILDLACGAGHLTHYLTHGLPQAKAIGLDREFFRLYVAKKCTAPQASFVCMPADSALPFEDGVFSGVVCSDAFHYFRQKSIAAREITRVVRDDGAVVLTRIGNVLVEPNEGYELSPSAYGTLFPSLKSTLRGEQVLMQDYLRGQSPDLSLKSETMDLEREKWITLFASRRADFFRNHGPFREMPHAVGRWVINPIFKRQPHHAGGLTLEFRFPSEWYAFEDGAYLTYCPREGVMPPDVEIALQDGRRTDSMRHYLLRFEIVGAPERFLPHPTRGVH